MKYLKEEILFVLIYGTFPTFVLYYTSGNHDKFFDNIRNFSPQDPIVIYIFTVYSSVLAITGFFKLAKGASLKYRHSNILTYFKSTSSSFKFIFQSVSGVILAFFVLVLIVEQVTLNNSLLMIGLLFGSYATLVPCFTLTEIENALLKDS